MGRRRNQKRRKSRKERIAVEADVPKVPRQGKTIPPVVRFTTQFRGGPGAPSLDLTFAGPLVKWDDPEDPSHGLREKVAVQKALEDDTLKNIN